VRGRELPKESRGGALSRRPEESGSIRELSKDQDFIGKGKNATDEGSLLQRNRGFSLATKKGGGF